MVAERQKWKLPSAKQSGVLDVGLFYDIYIPRRTLTTTISIDSSAKEWMHAAWVLRTGITRACRANFFQ